MSRDACRLKLRGSERTEASSSPPRGTAPVEPRLAGGVLERQPMALRTESVASATTETASRRLCLVKIWPCRTENWPIDFARNRRDFACKFENAATFFDRRLAFWPSAMPASLLHTCADSTATTASAMSYDHSVDRAVSLAPGVRYMG